MQNTKTKMTILINYGEFSTPVEQVKKLIDTILPQEQITQAYLKFDTMVDPNEKDFDKWNLHLYSKEIHVAICDANCGYNGDSPRLKTFRILQMAGFDVTVEEITTATKDMLFKK